MNKLVLIESTAILALAKNPEKNYLSLSMGDIEWFLNTEMVDWLKSREKNDYRIHWAGFTSNSKIIAALTDALELSEFHFHENTAVFLEALSRKDAPSRVALLSNFFPKNSRKTISTGEAKVLLCQTSPQDFDFDTVAAVERFLDE